MVLELVTQLCKSFSWLSSMPIASQPCFGQWSRNKTWELTALLQKREVLSMPPDHSRML